MTNNKQSGLDFQDPGALPKELMDAPGFINELKNHTLRTAARPNEPLAFAGAVAMLAHLAGRSYRDARGGRTNLYLAALAPSGMGKEAPREVNKRLAAELARLDALPDTVASGEALEDALARHPSTLLQSDEADTLLGTLGRGPNGTSRLSEMILRFYGEAKGQHARRLKANEGVAYENIVNPHLTIFATGIPQFVYDALTPRALENGLLGRCLFLDAGGFCPLGQMAVEPFPQRLLETAKFFGTREWLNETSGEIKPIVVPDAPEASELIEKMKLDCDAKTRELMAAGLSTAAALYVRVPEKVLKLSLIYALSENPYAPVITSAAVEWATKLVGHLTARMLYLAQFHVAEGKFDRLKKRFLNLLAGAGGSIDRSTVLRNMKIDSATLQKIVLTLHMSDDIEEEQLSRRKVIYSLKVA